MRREGRHGHGQRILPGDGLIDGCRVDLVKPAGTRQLVHGVELWPFCPGE